METPFRLTEETTTAFGQFMESCTNRFIGMPQVPASGRGRSPVDKDLIERGVFKNTNHQDHKAGLVLKALGFDPADPPEGFSKATIGRILRLEWSKRQEDESGAASA